MPSDARSHAMNNIITNLPIIKIQGGHLLPGFGVSPIHHISPMNGGQGVEEGIPSFGRFARGCQRNHTGFKGESSELQDGLPAFGQIRIPNSSKAAAIRPREPP